MTNREIAKYFDLLAKLMELHNENAFRIRSYQKAYNTLRQISDNVSELTLDELMEIPGIGKAIAGKIVDLSEKGTFSALESMLAKTPDGVVELMKLKGLGPKKIRLIWKELGVESLGELEYAINENRLTLLKGFGKKTQDNLLEQITYLNSVKGNVLINKAEKNAIEVLNLLKDNFKGELFEITGDLRRFMPFVSGIQILSTVESKQIFDRIGEKFEVINKMHYYNNIKIEFIHSPIDIFGKNLFISTGPDSFVSGFDLIDVEEENVIFEGNNIPFIPAVFRDNEDILKNMDRFDLNKYISFEDIKGVIHNHTEWSDGADSVLSLAKHFKSKGYKYMLVTDHSKSAFYANGLKTDSIKFYLEDIANANNEIKDFKIFSGIESDILMDGSLDYEDDILSQFDLVISSIHSVLRMDKEKATQRLLNAIENPYTRILGHMTGRILLSRKEYPLDYNRIFEACAKNNVVIELNANPHRLDIDWSLIDQAQEMGIKISINPDAHSKEEVDYIKYGVLMAQKGGLLKENCLNIKSVEEFEEWIDKRR